jgi:hypothetical protein
MSERRHPTRPGPVRKAALFILCHLLFSASASQAAGKRGEIDFIDIPVGGRPAALGGAYSALADDAYAVNVNPNGLGFMAMKEIAGQRLTTQDSIRHDYAGFGVPISRGSAFGGSIQNMDGGTVEATDAEGNAAGSFSSRFTAYNLSYGRAVTRRLSLGVTGKWINARIADVSAATYGADLGAMYRAGPKLTLAAVAANLGRPLTFLEEGTPLPTAFHLGAALRPASAWTFSAEGIFHRNESGSAHLGLEFRPAPPVALRMSYRTDAGETGALGGLTAGFGLQVMGNEISYAWLPSGGTGGAHYLSFNVRFEGSSSGTTRREK